MATSSTDTLVNRGLSLNMRTINVQLSKLFQRYSIALNKVIGGEILGFSQTRQLRDKLGVPIEYGKGDIVFKNGIDKFKFLMGHRTSVANSIGISSGTIYADRRDLGKVNEYLTRQGSKYDLGDQNLEMQMYISRQDSNIGSLDSSQNWIDYILTKTWIEKLGKATVDESSQSEKDSMLVDQRITYLTDMVQGMMADHEIEYHENLDKFDPDIYMDTSSVSPTQMDRYIDAMNRLHSFWKLDYCFYEMFKPIGGTTEKYIKVKMYTDGEMDISGVVDLRDCQHVEWEHGSREYLRALNTGNQKYIFNLSKPLNDYNSILWWKPDEKEPLEIENEEEEGEITEPTGYRYFKPYETERFLRWFGTNFIPMMDRESIFKKTICSVPILKEQQTSDDFYKDVRSIAEQGTGIAREQIDMDESLPLLSLAPKATIDVEDMMEPPGQHVVFIVSGNQQTSLLSFNIRGKVLNVIQEMHHYIHTWGFITSLYEALGKQILFLTLTGMIAQNVEELWGEMRPDTDDWIPKNWIETAELLERIHSGNAIDLLRFRQIDYEIIGHKISEQEEIRRNFLNMMNVTNDYRGHKEGQTSKTEYVNELVKDKEKADEILKNTKDQTFYCETLDQYIQKYGNDENGLAVLYEGIPLSQGTKEEYLIKTLNKILYIGKNENEQKELDEERSRYKWSFDDVTVDILRERIETYNNLVVRLPVDTYHNKIASRHIFLDWKAFVDGAVETLIAKKELFVKIVYDRDENGQPIPELDEKGNPVVDDAGNPVYKTKRYEETGYGTEHKGVDDTGRFNYSNNEHKYVELYIDKACSIPLIDYSYCIDEYGDPIHDRWDYWNERDFFKSEKFFNVVEN